MKNLITAFLLMLISLSTFALDKAPCLGTTVKGVACSRNAAEGNSYCFQHNPAANHCSMPTKAGAPCKRTVKIAGAHCSQHSK